MTTLARVLDFPEHETFDLDATIREAPVSSDESDPQAATNTEASV